MEAGRDLRRRLGQCLGVVGRKAHQLGPQAGKRLVVEMVEIMRQATRCPDDGEPHIGDPRRSPQAARSLTRAAFAPSGKRRAACKKASLTLRSWRNGRLPDRAPCPGLTCYRRMKVSGRWPARAAP